MLEKTLDEGWGFRRGLADSLGALQAAREEIVQLPHDAMIGTPVRPDAPAGADMGYFTGDLCNYTKNVAIPADWENGCTMLCFDGSMMHTTVEVNGSRAGGVQHYGYAPFTVDLTDRLVCGGDNRITIHTNTSMQPNSRWYTGTGLYRGVKLLHGPRVHILPDGIYVYTREVTDDLALLEAQVDVRNAFAEDHIVRVEIELIPEGTAAEKPAAVAARTIQVDACGRETARLTVHLAHPLIWDIETPQLYRVIARVTDLGVYRTHFIEQQEKTTDTAQVLFGVRTIAWDALRGLVINGRSVKLKGGCLHHDNGLLGAVSLYESEARKIRKLKEVGFNAVRTAHNPPSAALIEACDRLGMFVFDEAFDAWRIAKRGGDYSQYFDSSWESDLTAFVRRDRSHPSVILWSTGNEIPERGGLNGGYTLAARLADHVRRLDGSRPVSNGICSFWCGLDDELTRGRSLLQNAGEDPDDDFWERGTEPFTNGLDIVGYNYMEDLYERDHKLFPERVILGSENFPKEIGFRWPLVERLPYVIGDFTWTAWDYLGEAGIGKAVYLEEGDPLLEKGPWALMPQESTTFPWRTANDADYDITGYMRPQGAYRSIVWGSTRTALYVYPPQDHGKKEMTSPWGFPAPLACWNYEGFEGQPVEVLVFSGAQEAELVLDGRVIAKKAVTKDGSMPHTVRFETVYMPGKLEAVSYTDGKEVSRAVLETAGAPAALCLTPEKQDLSADGHDLVCIGIEVVDAAGRTVPNAVVSLHAAVRTSGEDRVSYGEGDGALKADEGACASSAGWLAGFGTGNPVTSEDYTDGSTMSYHGRAMAILRAGYRGGLLELTVSSPGLPDAVTTIRVNAVGPSGTAERDV